MLEVNHFNAVRITLASPEQIRSWSRGEVTKPETINYRTLKPERDGLFCERIFGPTKDWECSCGKYKRVRYKGIICDKCGVEVTRAKVRRERMGHIELASPVSHIWFVKGTPSRIGLLLDITPRTLEQVLYFAKYIVTDVNEDAKKRVIDQIVQDRDEKIQRAEQAAEEKIAELAGGRSAERAELEAQVEADIARRAEEVRAQVEALEGEAREKRAELEAHLNEAAPDEIRMDVLDGWVIVPQDAMIRADHVAELSRRVDERRDRIETDARMEDERAHQHVTDRFDARQDLNTEQITQLQSRLATETDNLRAQADARIAQIESIKPLQTLTEGEYRERVETCGRVFKAGMGAEAVRERLKVINLDELANELRTETRSSSGQRRKKATKRLRIVEAFRKSGNRPEWMIQTILPVLPPDLRPMVQLDGGRFATSDLNDLYRRVINRNNRLKRLQELGAPEIIVRNEKRMLQEAVDSLIDNGRRGRAVSGSSNHKLKSLSDMLKGKQGRFRQNLLGKRVDYSGRSVIVVGPDLQLHQCGLPKRMALELFKPFVMRKLVDKQFAHNIKSAKRIVERVREEVWDVLEEVIHEHPVLLNRAPTLHRLGIQAFEPRLIEGSAIQIHPLVCAAFNADFDGDQMAVHVPLSAAAKREAYDLMLSTNNLLQPSNGEPITAPTLDMVLGCYYLTIIRPGAKGEGRIFANAEDARLAFELDQIELQASIRVRIPEAAATNGHEDGSTNGNGNGHAHEAGPLVSTSVGRLIFNEAINNTLRDSGAELGAYRNEVMDKGSLKRLVSQLIRQHGNKVTAQALDVIKNLGFHYATRSGITIAISDIKVPEQKTELLAQADSEVARIERDYRRGLITDEERYNDVVAVWTQAKEAITDAVSGALDPWGPVHMMATSGAKGNVQQIAQMAGMRGLMADPSGRIIELPIRSSFRDGLSVLEYFLSTHGARKGLADTAIRTADSGYLTRRLIDVAQNIIVYDEDCGTDQGIALYDLADPTKKPQRLEQLVGRVTAQPVIHPDTGEIVLDANEEIDEDRRDAIGESDVKIITIRSPLHCESRHGVCQRCYGWHLGTRRLVRIGDAVGIVAAQSIGEPGTQLTMRTFHMGGVAGLDITSGLPRVEELFEARKPKGEAILSEIDGVVEVNRQDHVLRVVSQETYRDEHELPRDAELKVRAGEWVQKDQELAVAGDKPILAALAGQVEVTDDLVVVVAEDKDEREYTVPAHARIRPNVETGGRVTAGEQLTEGAKDPQDLLSIQGRDAVQRYLVDEIQEVYRSQGVTINDKHIEIIVRQMLRRLRVDIAGDSDLLPGELVDRFEYEDKNRQVLAEGGEPATAKPVLLGVTKSSLNTDSFLAAASFQETTKVLTEAALSGKVDHLLGLKENVIIGKLIPAGSGLEARVKARQERLAMAEARALFEAGEPVPAFPGVEGGFGDTGFGGEGGFGAPPSFGDGGFGEGGFGGTGNLPTDNPFASGAADFDGLGGTVLDNPFSGETPSEEAPSVGDDVPPVAGTAGDDGAPGFGDETAPLAEASLGEPATDLAPEFGREPGHEAIPDPAKPLDTAGDDD
jgi:DNA-directed RNA polymerase subunit beta'